MKYITSLFLFLAFFSITLSGNATDNRYDQQKALKFDQFLKKIAKENKPRVYLRRKSFDQTTVNSFLKLIYLPRYAREVKEANLFFKKDNWVSGKISIRLTDTKYKNLPAFLKEMDLELSGVLESRPEQMRFQIKELKLNSTSFSPEILDEAFSTFQGGNKIKRSIFDWFTLLPGIKRIGCDEGTLIVFY